MNYWTPQDRLDMVMGDHAIKSARWQHTAIGHRARFAVPGSPIIIITVIIWTCKLVTCLEWLTRCTLGRHGNCLLSCDWTSCHRCSTHLLLHSSWPSLSHLCHLLSSGHSRHHSCPQPFTNNHIVTPTHTHTGNKFWLLICANTSQPASSSSFTHHG